MAQRVQDRGAQTRARVLRAIRDYTREQQRPPSYDDIIAATGITSKGHIGTTLKRLEQDGAIRRLPGRRGIILTDAGRSA